MSTEENVPDIDEMTDEAPVAAPAVPAPVVREPLTGVTKEKPLCTVGRRKSAQARVRIWPGEGKISVNGRPLEQHFSLHVDQTDAMRPLAVAGATKKYDVLVNVLGGGPTGQAGAISLGIARAIVLLEPVHHRALRAAGLVTRDARVKERKKYGRRGARRGFQFSKR
jgi:small subunit ribosomal protein S9